MVIARLERRLTKEAELLLSDYFPKRMTVMDREVNLPLIQKTVDYAQALGLRAIDAEDLLVLTEDQMVVLGTPHICATPAAAYQLPAAMGKIVAGLRIDPSGWVSRTLPAQLDDISGKRNTLGCEALSGTELMHIVRDGIRLRTEIFNSRRDHFLSSFSLKLALSLIPRARRRYGALWDQPIGDEFPTRRFKNDLTVLAAAWDSSGSESAADLYHVTEQLDRFIECHGGKAESFVPLVSDEVWDVDATSLEQLLPLLKGASGAPHASAGVAPSALTRRMQQIAAERDWVVYAYEQASRLIRDALLQLGGELAESTLIATPRDVFHLTLEELDHIAAGDNDAQTINLQALIAQRRVATAPQKVQLTPAQAEPRQIGGIGASPGTFVGRAAVISSMSELGEFRAGDILVCDMTSPMWIPLLAAAGAVVTDRGGLLSHAAIVAREFGKPAVIGTKLATSQMQSGRRYLVNGDRGVVRPVAGD